MDAQAPALGADEQFGVEEPLVVADLAQQLAREIGAHGLEAALRIAEARPQDRVQDRVVAAREELSARAAHDARAVRQPRPDRDVAVAGQERGDER